MDFRTVFHNSHPNSGIHGLFLIRRPEEWQREWQRIHGHRPDLPLAEVDFPREAVVLLGTGIQSTLGYDVTITEVERSGDLLAVTATETRNVGVGLRATCSPLHAVAVELGGPPPIDRLLLHLLSGPLIDPDEVNYGR